MIFLNLAGEMAKGLHTEESETWKSARKGGEYWEGARNHNLEENLNFESF